MAPHPDELAPAPIDPAGHEAHLSKSRKGKEPANDGFRREGNELDLRLLGQKIMLAGLSNMVRQTSTFGDSGK